jgi:peptidyl-prolyl cis-trans isomerase A (cyclophilin A)
MQRLASAACAISLALVAAACKHDSTGSSRSSFPGPEAANERAPDQYKARFETSKGTFVVEVHRDWAPNGADRFFNLVKIGFFDGARFFRVVPGFVVQWGIHADGDDVMSRWRGATFPDDPVEHSNEAGTLTFATSGPNSRSTQVFVNYGDNARLDAMGFAPFGKVSEGMSVVLGLSSAYGQRPDQAKIQREGNAYLEREFPGLDWIKKGEIAP